MGVAKIAFLFSFHSAQSFIAGAKPVDAFYSKVFEKQVPEMDACQAFEDTKRRGLFTKKISFSGPNLFCMKVLPLLIFSALER